MPGTSGLELQMQLIEERSRTPVIFITAFDGPNVRRQARKAGAVAMLGKPFDDTVLIETVRGAIRADA
jgi:two-component system response regulator FixJ